MFLVRWGPVLVWMILIFVASADPESGPRGSRLLVPLIRWLVPDIGPEALDRVVFGVRKVAHFASFGILAVLIWRALVAGSAGSRTWNWRTAGWALLATAAYAVTDEVHQLFVPTRVGSVGDVGIDTLGGAFALGCIGLLFGLRRRR